MALKTFDVTFYRPLGDNLQDTTNALVNLLFLSDAPADTDVLSISVDSLTDMATSLTLLPPANTTASDANFHFQLYFDPDTLAQLGQVELVPNPQWSLARKDHANTQGDSLPGCSLYLLYTGGQELALAPGQAFQLALRKLAATTTAGTRPGVVKFSWNDATEGGGALKFVRFAPADDTGRVLIHGHGDKYALEATKALDLVNTGGKATPPLGLFVTTSNVILNDGSAQNYVSLRLINLGEVALPLGEGNGGSKSSVQFVLSFAASSNTSDTWALATAAQLQAAYIPGKSDSSGTVSNWSSDWSIQRNTNPLSWTISPGGAKTSLAPGEALDIPISNLVTGHVIGQSAIRMRFLSLPGYGDGDLAALLQKAPALYRDATLQRLAIGTNKPTGYPLTVDSTRYGIAHINGDVQLATWVDDKGGWLGTYSPHSLHFYTGRSDAHVTIDIDGKLGINTTTPKEQVHVVGGDLRVDGNIKSYGPIDLYPNVDKTPADENLLRLRDKDTHIKLTVTSDGKLGLGTDSPGYPLTVQSTRFGIAHVSGGVELSTFIDSSGGWIGTKSNSPFHLYANNSGARVTLTQGGNLGVGTTTPSQLLHVNGNVQFDGRILVKGTRPIVFKTYKLATFQTTVTTEFSTNDWAILNVGWNMNSTPEPTVPVLISSEGNHWVLTISTPLTILATIDVIFVRRELADDYDSSF